MEASQPPHQANCCETYKYYTSFSVKHALLKVQSEWARTLHAVGNRSEPPEKSLLNGSSQKLFTLLRPCSIKESFQYNERPLVHHPLP